MKRPPRLTRRQLSILLFIATYQSVYQRPPTCAEVAAKFQVRPQSMRYQVAALCDRGYAEMTPNVHRSLRLTGKELA